MKKPHVGKPVGATATVNLTVEVKVESSWGPDCSIAQVHHQAAEAARGALRNAVASSPAQGRIRVIGQPEVKTVIVERV